MKTSNGPNRLVVWALLAGASTAVACSGGGAAAGGAPLGSPVDTPARDESDAAPGVSSAIQTLTLETEHVMVTPGSEVYKCQDFANPFGKDVAITQTFSQMTPGSHHFFAFVMGKDEVTLDHFTDCPQGGLEYHDFIHMAQVPAQLFPYPTGVGRYYPSSKGFRLNVHVINTTQEPIDAFVSFKMTYVDPSLIQQRAATMFLNDIGLSVPPGKSTTQASYKVPYDIFLMGAGGHMHRRGVHFAAQTSDGTMLYETTDWAEPTPRQFDPPLAIKGGTVIKWSCDYQNDTDQTFAFGESAAINEMCIFPGTFYGGDGSGFLPLVDSDP